MEYVLQRFSSAKESTLGTIHLVRGAALTFRCFSLEDQYNSPKIPKETRIPPGKYEINLRNEGGMTARYAERFDFHKGMLWLQNVPGFEFVYIHIGNDDDDTEGCILVGDGAQSNILDDGMVTSSVNAYKRLYREITQALQDEQVFITIQDFA